MATARISATGLSVAFEHFPPVFSDIDLHLGAAPVALIGRNGSGKSLLAECLAGIRQPTSGSVRHHVPVANMAQFETETDASQTMADFLGVSAALAALDRLLSGQGRVDDLSLLDERWSLREELEASLAEYQLDARALHRPVSQLSGGQRTCLTLLRLSRQSNSYLILDEPTNHLDRAGRRWLQQWLLQRSEGTLVVTHDRDLLDQFSQLIELRDGRLHHYGQGFTGYQAVRSAELEKAMQDISHARQTIKRERQQQQAERESHEKRASKGRAKAAKKDMPKVLLGGMKERSENSGGRIKSKHQGVIAREQARLQQAKMPLGTQSPQAFPLTPPGIVSGCLVVLNQVVLPRTEKPHSIDWQLMSGERWWLGGPNGSGKSTFLAALNADLSPISGEIRRRGRWAMLDQSFALLDNSASSLENYQRLNPGWEVSEYRDRLAWLGLRGDQVLKPAGNLSGGERLKLALASVMMGPQSVDWVLLDEPDNHLDLESQNLLASSLREYSGALVVVTHSKAMAKELDLGLEMLMPEPFRADIQA